jgi:hypothetical protein
MDERIGNRLAQSDNRKFPHIAVARFLNLQSVPDIAADELECFFYGDGRIVCDVGGVQECAPVHPLKTAGAEVGVGKLL